MMDGVSVMDTGSNGPLLQMNVESIAEVKVLTSSYQAEYGRSSGVQITAVTKSGTNRFRGSVYDVERNSDWNANSKTNKLNGDPKTVAKEKDWGYSIGGPIGKPGGNNKLFFFYSQEFAPRTGRGNDDSLPRARRRSSARATSRRRSTTTARSTTSSRIRTSRAPASRPTTPRCFADGGVLGQDSGEPALRPGPERPEHVPDAEPVQPGRSSYNYQIGGAGVRPSDDQITLPAQPAIRLDYQPGAEASLPAIAVLRARRAVRRWTQRGRADQRHLPGLQRHEDAEPGRQHPSVHGQLQLNQTTFLEGTYGRSRTSWPAARSRRAAPGRPSAPPRFR